MEKLFLKESKNWKLLNKRFLKFNTIFIVVILFIFSNSIVNAQMECRSMIGAHLTPFGKNIPVSWAIEGTMSPGFMTSAYDNKDNAMLNGGMLLGALEFNLSENNNIYIEGGYKNWKNSALVNDKKLKNRHFGVRQFFYSYSTENFKVKFGLHETRLGNFFLVDERVLGGSMDRELGAFNLHVRAGTVLKNFARMGQFCSNRHLYGVIHSNYTERIGEKIGETNMAGFVIDWNPYYKEDEKLSGNDDEFADSGDEFSDNSTDEFHTNHDFNEFGDKNMNEFNEENSSFVKLSNIGFIIYDEFGKIIPDNKLYIGSLFDFALPSNFILQTGPVFQSMPDNNAVVFIAKLGRSVSWVNASNTKFTLAYIGKYDIDENAIFQPLFSNLFLGEIMRMDAPDFPLWQAAVKHNFANKIKLHIALKAVGQINTPYTNEQNIEVGVLVFNNHLKTTLIGSRVQTDALPNSFYTVRLETRLAF